MGNIIDAVENNDIEYVKNNLGKFNPNQIGQYGFPLLHRAAYFGYLEMIELLIDNSANIDILDEDNFTPLHSIIEGNEDNWFDTIKLLIKKGANVNSYMNWRDMGEAKSKESILITAIKDERHIEVIKLLLENGADVDFVDANGDKAINYANDLRFYEAFELLKEYGAEYDGKITKEEEILQDYAVGMEESYKLRAAMKIKQFKKDKFIGSLIGLAVGDALGAPYEFKKYSYRASRDFIEGGVHNVSIGEWTDDTAMALCLAQSLIDNNSFDAKDQMEKYLSWYKDGYFSTRPVCFDIGNTVVKALRRFKQTKEPYSGVEGDENSGNGSLMRLAPIALHYYNDKEALIKYARLSSQTTHKSEIAVDACIYYAQLIAGALQGITKEKLFSSTFVDSSHYRQEIKKIVNGLFKQDKEYVPTGYVVDTLETALHAFYKYDSFEDGLLYVVSLGYDTDTVGAVYGQLAGAYYGYESIPNRWTSKLIHNDMISEMAKELYNRTKNIYKTLQTEQKKTHILVGDITTVNTEAIVNAANYRLLGGGGVDGAIHRAGGDKILQECQYLRNTRYPNGLPVGEAVITTAGNLKAKYVIHIVGPQYRWDKNPSKHLAQCYKNSFLLADKYKCKSIAYPSIATGVYAYPKEEAGVIAYKTITKLLEKSKYVKDVVFVFYSNEDADIFRETNEIV